MNNEIDFRSWIDDNIHDLEEGWSAYQTVLIEKDYHPFTSSRRANHLLITILLKLLVKKQKMLF